MNCENDENNKLLSSPLTKLLNDRKINQITYQRVITAKKYIERKYNIIKLKKVENNILHEKLNQSGLPENKRLEILKEIEEKEIKNIKIKSEKMTANNYESLSIIGRGGFGEVHVCRDKRNGEIVAIKKIKKEALLLKNQIRHTMDEQDFLSKVNSPWIVKLKASFQEGDYLYLVMEYLPGGDLMGLFIDKDILTEDEARFYICEIILAIDSIHELNCIHRDIKPDNILIGKDGHIKLTDFGLAKISDKVFKEDIIDYNVDKKKIKHKRNYSCVGTAYYVAPEVILKKGYGKEIDWWSLGVILFEMVAGYAPFCSQNTKDVCYKVTHFNKYLKFPSKCKVSEACKDLIYKLVNNSNIRLGKNGSQEIKAHPFFKGVNWLKIKEMKPPFIPELSNDYDVKYFDEFSYIEPFIPQKENIIKKRKDPEYIGYTFKGDIMDPTDILSIINLIQQKQSELEKEKQKININSMKDISVEEAHEDKKTEDSSNYYSNNIKEINDEMKNKVTIKSYLTKKNSKNNINNKYKHDANNNIKRNIENPFKVVNKNKTLNISAKSGINKLNKKNEKFTNIPQISPKIRPKKKTLLENVSHGLKNVFKRNSSINKKNK